MEKETLEKIEKHLEELKKMVFEILNRDQKLRDEIDQALATVYETLDEDRTQDGIVLDNDEFTVIKKKPAS